jgi:hypothetical protein
MRYNRASCADAASLPDKTRRTTYPSKEGCGGGLQLHHWGSFGDNRGMLRAPMKALESA